MRPLGVLRGALKANDIGGKRRQEFVAELVQHEVVVILPVIQSDFDNCSLRAEAVECGGFCFESGAQRPVCPSLGKIIVEGSELRIRGINPVSDLAGSNLHGIFNAVRDQFSVGMFGCFLTRLPFLGAATIAKLITSGFVAVSVLIAIAPR
ncbi:hypothetical protein [Bradyrhizobium neotropicale]|uniref:hypothetical protein n=1 Tax=Bradyrhizobium neotropicale TaxID=1497615 RepID=UPI001AD75889|nr:hypothetical protein [Bradyrhizobium neotropicale]MBO4227229.1 hypothetical protein [Bradyrhizobium neotropicale]